MQDDGAGGRRADPRRPCARYAIDASVRSQSGRQDVGARREGRRVAVPAHRRRDRHRVGFYGHRCDWSAGRTSVTPRAVPRRVLVRLEDVSPDDTNLSTLMLTKRPWGWEG